jgi:outer membrane receptor for Fe3+-dicitrate
MTDTIHVRGGWSRDGGDRLPPLAKARQEAEERQERQQERERAAQLEQIQERNLMLAMDQAVQRGELVSVSETMRTRGANIGRTRTEALAYYSAVQDRDDAVARVRARREMQRLGVDEVAYSEMYSGDISAPSAAEQAEVAAERAKLDRRYASRARDQHIGAVARGVAEGVLIRARESALLRRWSA